MQESRLVGFNNRGTTIIPLRTNRVFRTLPESSYKLSKRIIESTSRPVEGIATSPTRTCTLRGNGVSREKLSGRSSSASSTMSSVSTRTNRCPRHWAREQYCDNDVISTEGVRYLHDWVARQVLAGWPGLRRITRLTPDNTNHFRQEKHPHLVYTDLGEECSPDTRSTNAAESTYKGVEVGEGGYVYAEPGIHRDVALLDVASLHPSPLSNSICSAVHVALSEIKMARIAVKHGDGIRCPESSWGALTVHTWDRKKSSQPTCKIAINSVYGLTAVSSTIPFGTP